MPKLYSRNDPVKTAYLVKSGQLRVELIRDQVTTFPADQIIVGTIEYFLSNSIGIQIPRIFDLYLDRNGSYDLISFETVREMMLQWRFGTNTNIFIARLIEYITDQLIEKSKTPLGPLRRYQRRAGTFARTVDMIYDLGLRHNLPEVRAIAEQRRPLETYQDGSLHPHYQSIEAIPSPAKDRSPYIRLYKKNSLICHEGSSARELYILLDGSINVTFRNLLVARIKNPGEAFGEMSLFLDQKRTASLVANEDSNLYVVPYAELPEFTRAKCPDLFIKIAAALSLRLAETLQKLIRIDKLLDKGETVQNPESLLILIDQHFKLLDQEIKEISKKTKDPQVAYHLLQCIKA